MARRRRGRPADQPAPEQQPDQEVVSRRRRRRGQPQVDITNQAVPQPSTAALAERQFNSIIRGVKRMSADSVTGIFQSSTRRLEELGHRRNGKPITKTPEGSDQVDIGSVLTWMKEIKKDDSDAIAQLKAIQATASLRQ